MLPAVATAFFVGLIETRVVFELLTKKIEATKKLRLIETRVVFEYANQYQELLQNYD